MLELPSSRAVLSVPHAVDVSQGLDPENTHESKLYRRLSGRVVRRHIPVLVVLFLVGPEQCLHRNHPWSLSPSCE